MNLKQKKKMLSALLAFTMVLQMSMPVVFAEGEDSSSGADDIMLSGSNQPTTTGGAITIDLDGLVAGNLDSLNEGDKVGDFEVIHTPGHSYGGICLWDGENLICGDTVFANGGYGRTDIGGNMDDLRNSLRKLNKLNVKYLFPGHGPWVDNGKKHIELSNHGI